MSHYKPYPAYKDSGVEWLGRVPENWDIRAVKTLARLDGGAGFPDDEQGQSDNPIPFFKVAELASGLRYTENTVTEETAKRLGAKIFPPSTLVFAKVGAALLLNRRCLLERPACLDNNMMALLPGPYDSQWLFWVFSTLDMGRIANPGAVPSINQEQVGNIRLGLPSLAEQRSIARSLNRETARIDALVAKKTRFIELLREKRQALITHAVTKGLDPKVKMKDSGVEWLGEVPEHWGVKQLKHVVDPNSSITYGIVQAGPEYEGGVPYIRTSDMSSDELPVSGYPLTSPEIDESYARSRVRPGDIVMSIRASVGKCLPVPNGLSVANLTQGTAKISPGSRITRDYLLAYLNSGAAQVYFDLMAKGATFREITLDALRRTPVLVPPAHEQAVIDQFIARHVARLDGLVQLSERSLVMLKERRSALITASVTGQIDLREAV